MASRSAFPEPPGASQGPSGRAKTAQRGAKSDPRARSASGAVLAAIWRPNAAQELPGGQVSAASSAAFRGAASTASPPFQSTAPEAKIAKECQNQKSAHRPAKQALATKRLASKRWSAVSRCVLNTAIAEQLKIRRPPLAV